MKIQIRNRWTLKVIFEHECETVKEAVVEANLRGADLMDANLRGADLRGADLRGANLRGANLMDADLRGADLRGADLRGANLMDADLRGANLRGANLMDANLRGANLMDANLMDANLIAINLPFYTVYIQKEKTRIGCEYHSNKEWRNFTDSEIKEMDGNALEFWNSYKALIFAAIDSLQGDSDDS